jgi:hypothetical protein
VFNGFIEPSAQRMKDVVESKLHNTYVKGKFSALPKVGIDLHHLDIRSAKQVRVSVRQVSVMALVSSP